MLVKKYRLRNKKDFGEVFKKGATFQGVLLILKKKAAEEGQLKIGFIAPQKVIRKASQRNKIKRILREITKEKIKEIKKGHCLIFSVKKEIETATRKELIRETEVLLKKAALLKEIKNA